MNRPDLLAMRADVRARGAGTAFLTHFVLSPLEERRHQWMEEIGQRLIRMSDQIAGGHDQLRNSPTFGEVASHVLQVISRTASDVKREALGNAILNVALRVSLDGEREHAFVRLVDELSPLQLRMLDLFDDPTDREAILHPRGILDAAIPEIAGQPDVADLLWQGLRSRDLIYAISLDVAFLGTSATNRRTTPLGRELLAFIKPPPASTE